MPFFKACVSMFALAMVSSAAAGLLPASRAEQARTVITFSIPALESELLDLANRDREKEGLRLLLADADLMAIAKAHSEKMAKESILAHAFPGWSAPARKLADSGRWFLACSENVASSNAPVAAVIHDALMASPLHRLNILDPRLTHLGIGVARGDKFFYVTQEFAYFVEPQPTGPAARRIEDALIDLYRRRFQKSLEIVIEAKALAPLIARQCLVGDEGIVVQMPWGACRILNFIHNDLDTVLAAISDELREDKFGGLAVGANWGRNPSYPGGAYSVSVFLFLRQ